MKKKKIATKRRNKKRLQPQPSAQDLLAPVEVLVSDPPPPVPRELTPIEIEAMHCAANMELYGTPYPTSQEKAASLLTKRIIEI